MSDTISIRLDNSDAVNALEGYIASANEAEQANRDLTVSGEEMADSQERQITVIHRQSMEWKSLSAVALPVLGEITVAGLHTFETIAEIEHSFQSFLLDSGKMVLGTGLKMLQYGAIAKGTIGVVGAFKGKTEEAAQAEEKHGSSLASTAFKATIVGAAITTLTGKWDSVGQVATAAASIGIKSALSMAGPIAVVVAGVEALRWSWENTGKRVDAITGQTTSNLDRIGSATGRLAENIAAMPGGFSDLAKAQKDVIVETLGLDQAWSAFDRRMTASADGLRDMIAEGSRWVSTAGDIARANKRMDEQREAEKEHFARLRGANQSLENRPIQQYEATRAGQVGQVAQGADDTKKMAGLRVLDDQIDAKKKDVVGILDVLKKAEQDLDGSARAEKAYAQAIITTRKAMADNKEATLELIERRRQLNMIPAGQSMLAAFDKATEAEKAAIQDIDRRIQKIREQSGANAAALKFDAAAEAQYTAELNHLVSLREQRESESVARRFAEQKQFREADLRLTKEATEHAYVLMYESNEKIKRLQKEQFTSSKLIAQAARDFQNEMNLKTITDAEEASQHRLSVAEKEAKRLIDLKYQAREKALGDRGSAYAGLENLAKEREVFSATIQFEEQQRQEAFQADRRGLEESTKQKLQAIAQENTNAKKFMTNEEERRQADVAAENRKVNVILEYKAQVARLEIKLADETAKAKRGIGEQEIDFERRKAQEVLKAQEHLFAEAEAAKKKTLESDIEKLKKKMEANQQSNDFDLELQMKHKKDLEALEKKKDQSGIAGLMKNQPKKAVKKEYIDLAKKKADAEFRKKNADLAKKGEMDPEARAQFDQKRKKALADAGRKAALQFGKGKGDDTMVAQAQANAAGQTADAMAKAGKLEGDLVAAIKKQLQTAANTAQTVDVMDKQLKDISKGIDAVLEQTNRTRNRAGAGGQRG